MILNSNIKQVTVYRDRAYIERSVICKFKKGENNITIQGLPNSIDSNSLQIYSNDNLILQDVKLKSHGMQNFSDQEKQGIVDEMKKIESSIQESKDKLYNLQETKQLFKKIFNNRHRLLQKSADGILGDKEIEKTLQFYNEKLNDIDSSIRKEENEINKLTSSLKILKDKVENVDYEGFILENRLHLEIFSDADLETSIGFSYLTYNSSWKAFYDIRLNSEQKRLDVAYSAIINQETGEDWKDVKLKLSTAQPQLAGNLPQINTWYVDVYNNDLDYNAYDDFDGVDGKGVKRAVSIDEVVENNMAVAEASIENTATSVVFDLHGQHTILANNEEHKVGITQLHFNAELEYNSVPKLNPMSYLTAKLKNNSDFTFLKGRANIFLDNNFVSQSDMNFVAPNEEFETYLGVDQNIKIEHKLVNRFTKTEGLLSKKNKVIFDYKIKIENRKATEVKIKIKDQVPVSQNNNIKVELINPDIKENTDTLTHGEDGIIEQIISLKSEETKELDLKFSVEYPKDIELRGL